LVVFGIDARERAHALVAVDEAGGSLGVRVMRLAVRGAPAMAALRRERGELTGGCAGLEQVADQAGEVH
jgi:hypothetical protein